MFDSQRSQMCIGSEIAASPHGHNQVPQYPWVPWTSVNDSCGRLIQPGIDEIESDLNGERIAE